MAMWAARQLVTLWLPCCPAGWRSHSRHTNSTGCAPEQEPCPWQRGTCSLSRDYAVSRQQAACQPSRLESEKV